MRILFVEDDTQLRSTLARGLRESGHDVDEVASGLDALTSEAAGGFDIVILDVLLPGLDGITVCRRMRERGSRVPILMLTALDAVEQRITGLDAGADDYLTKPFDFGELLARIRAVSRRRAQGAGDGAGDAGADRLVVGDLVIDTARHRARRGSRDITLTATEFAFLAYLARNAGRVVSRAELMEHVWEDTRNTYSNIIDAYASRLRRKIDDGESLLLFTTVRGIGYMLESPERAAPPAQED
ncbi:MAG TPA: response regulator transcription factor [Gemmatimonas sp.]|nr:response regulator transcription factor [Gemmatimonas sp.]